MVDIPKHVVHTSSFSEFPFTTANYVGDRGASEEPRRRGTDFMPSYSEKGHGGVTEEDRKYQRVILLDPPPTDKNLIVTLPDGTTFRPMELMVCPLCKSDYKLGTAESCLTKYRGIERIVTVCRMCASKPPADYRKKLMVALDEFLWCDLSDIKLEAPFSPR